MIMVIVDLYSDCVPLKQINPLGRSKDVTGLEPSSDLGDRCGD